MVTNYLSILSKNLSKEIRVAVYGHYGFVLLVFPANSDDYKESEENGLIQAIQPSIEKGKCRVVTFDTINQSSWLNNDLSNEEKSDMHLKFNNFLVDELVPFVFKESGGLLPIITCGANVGAYHAANSYFRRPDLFFGTIAMSGFFNIEYLTNGYFDTNCYFNSPIHYLPLLEDSYWLSFLRSNHHIYILTSTHPEENQSESYYLTNILTNKEIPHNLDIWGTERAPGYETWNAMLSKIIDVYL